MVIKKIYNSLRYYSTALQLIKTKNIYDFSETNHIKSKIFLMQTEGKTFNNIKNYLMRQIKIYTKKIRFVHKYDINN